MAFGSSSFGSRPFGSAPFRFAVSGTQQRALVLVSGAIQQITNAQLGTNLKPLVIDNGVLKQRVATEGSPLVLVDGVLRTLAAGETLLL